MSAQIVYEVSRNLSVRDAIKFGLFRVEKKQEKNAGEI